MIGKTINNYVIERKLGDGGMGTAYYAKHNRVEREVAIKILHSDHFSNENIRNRFKNEANALIKLTHPNIVQFYDYVEQDNFACLIMEYITGYTLGNYISKIIAGSLPVKQAILIMSSVLDALQYAHDHGIFHRDIKPDNIMVDADGKNVKVMDFGIAKLSTGISMKTTVVNTQMGTPFYMSPEQVKMLPYTAKSDIYSLGVTLFEMVTGKCPYLETTNLFELQSKIVNEPLPSTDKYYPGVPKQIQNAIKIATNKDPEKRFQSCTEFKTYLKKATKEKIISFPAPKPSVFLERVQKKSKLVYLFLGITVISIMGFIIVNKLIKNTGQNNLNEEQSASLVAPPSTNQIQENTSAKDSPLNASKEILISEMDSAKAPRQTEPINLLNEKKPESKPVPIVQPAKIIVPKKEPVIPTLSVVTKDLLKYLKGSKPCGISFLNSNQIAKVRLVQKSDLSVSQLKFEVDYEISENDDNTTTEDCKAFVYYVLKNDTEYRFDKIEKGR